MGSWNSVFKKIAEMMPTAFRRDVAGFARVFTSPLANQRAALTLLRMRNGGRQVVTVQHVNISGGQAIVAGAVSATGGAFAEGDHDSAQ